MDWHQNGPSSPVFNYPYERTRAALESMRQAEEWDDCHGLKLRYVNPGTGDFAMPTMATFMQLLPAGFQGQDYQSTDGMVFSVVEGTGRTRAGSEVLSWGPRDTFVVPSWCRYRHEAGKGAKRSRDGDLVAAPQKKQKKLDEKLGSSLGSTR